jgi:putative membrane protein
MKTRRSVFSRVPTGKEFLAIGVCVAAAVTTLWVTTRPPSGLAAANSQPTAVTSVPTNLTPTKWGPLSDNDRLLLIKVRQAGLWEMPTGQQAQQRASDDATGQKVKAVGQKIAAEHGVLDADTRNTAAQLGVNLPSAPNADQQSWMAELSTKTGDDYDRDFAYRLRAAHGKVFSVIALVRATTQNSLIRDFATRAMAFVLRHMTYLESTGLVDYSTLN